MTKLHNINSQTQIFSKLADLLNIIANNEVLMCSVALDYSITICLNVNISFHTLNIQQNVQWKNFFSEDWIQDFMLLNVFFMKNCDYLCRTVLSGMTEKGEQDKKDMERINSMK